MAEKEVVRKIVPFKSVVKSPGFNYRKNLPAAPDDIKALLHDNIKKAQEAKREGGEEAGRKVKVFDWPKIDQLIKDNKDLNAAQRVKLRRVLGLAQNVYRRGLLEPIIVRESGADKDENRTYFLVAGERRYLALDAIGATQVEVKVKKGTEVELKIDRLSENVQREDPDPFEEADALAEFLEEKKGADSGYTQAQLAEELGVSEAYISQRLGMRKRATPELREAVEIGQVSTAMVREMVSLPAKEANEILKGIQERLSKGEKVTAADVKDKTDAAKIEQKAKANKKDGKAEKDDAKAEAKGDDEGSDLKEGLELAKEHGYDFKGASVRSKKEVFAAVGVASQRFEKAKTDRSKSEWKGAIRVLEWMCGKRESL